MGGGGEESLFFLTLPDLRKLCCVTLSLHHDESEARNQQIKTCRELVLLYSDLLASPALDSVTDVMLVMAIPFFKKGIIQAYTQRHNFQMDSPQRVLPGILQACLSYTLTARLAPTWNKAGLYLINGKDFLTQTGKLNAAGMELTTSESQLCISVEASRVRLPPARLEDFDIPPMVLKNFYSHPDSIIHTYTMGGSNWCYILPSMKRGQVISISRQLPPDSPFRSYADLQTHWNSLYGYRLPELAEEELIYCGVYFKLVGERLFTYPLSCIRALPVQRCPRLDLQGALGSFISDVRDRLHSVRGFPVRMTGRPCYRTTGLTRTGSEQMLSGKPVNLTTKSSSRPVLTQLPPPAPPPTKPSFGSQPPARPPPSHQPGAQINGEGRERREGSQDSAYGSGSSEIQREREWSSSTTSSNAESSSFSSSSSSSLSSHSSGYHSALSLSSSSCISSSFSSSFYSSPIPSSQPLAPKLVPIFKNKSLTRHVNVTQLLHQKQKEQRRGGGEERGRVTLVPALGQKRQAPAPSFSLSNPSIPSSSTAPSSLFSSSSSSNSRFTPKWPQSAQLPPPSVPRFTQQPKPHGFTSHLPSRAHSNLNLSHRLNSSSNPCPSFSQGGALTSRGEVPVGRGPQPPPPPPQPPRPLTPSDIPSNRGGDVFESKPKRSKRAVQDVDVETMARNNQLSKVNAATLLAWLKGKGVAVRAKDRKEELVLKVMACLGCMSEA